MRWDGKIYIDEMLPFGLRSVPKIFNSVANTLESAKTLKKICSELGIPLAPEKQDGPSPVITLETVRGKLRLPEKSERLLKSEKRRKHALAESWSHSSKVILEANDFPTVCS